MRSFFKNYWALLIPALVLIIALFFFMRRSGGSSEGNTVIGMVDANFVDVAAGFPGRMDSLLVHQGDTVQKGQLLGVLHTTEINAIRSQALAAIDVAQSQLQLLRSGARPEAIQAANKLYQITQDQYALMQKTYGRIENLYREQVISGQEKDIIYFKLQAAEKEMETARLNMEMLKNGSRPELITAAAAILKQAQDAYTLTSSLSDKTNIRAPSDGIISSMVIEEGEIVSIGYPLMTIQQPSSYFIRFNIRQDAMKSLPVGTTVKMRIPGCVPETFDAKVSKVAPSLTFANWVPVKEKGLFELRTFTVECKPVNESALQGLRPGMTASMQLP
jgi:HlyD family secretion protein